MTRGKMLFLDVNNKIYSTTEFNGDMYPEGRGDQIIQAFEDGHLQDVDSFYAYVTRFDRRNFHYAEYGEELIRCTLAEQIGILDVRKNWTDYLYIVNESGKEYTLLTSEGEISLGMEQMAIVRYQQLNMIKEGAKSQREKAAFLISREEFASVLQKMEETRKLIDDIDERLREFKDSNIQNFCSGAGMVITNEECVLRLLSLLTEDKLGDIDYFVYELKYGKEYQEGCVTSVDGSFVDLSCAEKLYDYLETQKNDEIRRECLCN